MGWIEAVVCVLFFECRGDRCSNNVDEVLVPCCLDVVCCAHVGVIIQYVDGLWVVVGMARWGVV